MALSSTSLFHFTSSLENLENILANDFFAFFSLENFLNVIFDKDDDGLEKALPMVCFCDIPLSKVTKHTEMYGNYSIGMTKEWAITNKINPIIYTYNNSKLATNIYDLMLENTPLNNEALTDKIKNVVQYIKPYSGNFKKNGQTFENVKFYDEREWRYIADIHEKNSWLKKTDKPLSEAVSNVNKVMRENNGNKSKLKFEAKDIKYIIVKDDNDIHRIMNFFKNLKSAKYSMSEIELLVTKITSLDDIVNDY